jgi:superfamily II DNA or RNA helicase
MDSIQLLITSLIALAGKSRLPTKLIIKDETISEQDMLQDMERNVQEYIKSTPDFGKKLHDIVSKNKILKNIQSIINENSSSIKDSYLKLWENFLNNNGNNKENIDLMNIIMTKMTNKKLKTNIELANKTPSKIKNSIKTILNVSPPFVSIFVADVLDKKEQMIHNNIVQNNVNYTNKIDTFMEVANFGTDEDLNISLFYNDISKVTDPVVRNQYYNMILSKLIVNELVIKIGNTLRLCPVDSPKNKNREHIFMQIYTYFINYEKIKDVDDNIKEYLKLKNQNWFSYQVTEFSNKLCPNWPFKSKGFNLDLWQKNTIKAIDEKKNILLSLPTSAGKTILSTYTIRTYNKVCYLVPSEALAYQLTGITLASLADVNNVTKNVRQETNGFSFKKYPSEPDNIIIATPIEFFKLLITKTVDPNFDYIIFDEFHNITDEILGSYIEYILKFAGYYGIPIMALSATIPNFTELHQWLEKLLNKEVFGVYEKKRFFNQKRFYIKNGKLEEINPLEYITKETLLDPTFTQIGLYPIEIMKLRDQVQSYKYNSELDTDEKSPDIVSLDKLHILEGKIFEYLKQSPEIIDKINENTKDQENINISQTISVYKLFRIMKETKDKKMMPMLIFKMDSKECMDIYYLMLNMLKSMEVLIYPGFNSVNKIIQSYFDTLSRESGKLELDSGKDKKKGEGKEKSIDDMVDNLKDTLYGSPGGVKAQLEEFYINFVNNKIEPIELEHFNKKYGADLTEEYIINMRKKHANRELRMYNNPQNLRLRNIFASHSECRMMDTTVAYEEMKKIKRSVNSEITRDTRLKEGMNAHIPTINYDHPFMLGIERGIICYNMLMSPALQRVCQQLINNHPFVTFSDKSLAVGINYPIRTVMLLGTTDDTKELEIINNTLAHQACGRAGRRGLDSEGYIIYAGVNISNILIPKYTVVKRNSVEKMSELFTDNIVSEQFKNYVLNEIRSDKIETIWKYDSLIDLDKIAEELFRLQTPKDVTLNIDNDDDADGEYTFNSGFETLEQIKAKLVSKYTFKPKVSVSLSSNQHTIISDTNINVITEEYDENKPIELESFDDWETAADEDLKKNKKLISDAESTFM